MIGPRGERLRLAEFIAGAGLDDRISEVAFGSLNLSDRIDAEYFLPRFLEIATRLKGRGRKLRDLAKLSCSAFYPAATHLYDVGDVPFIRCVDVVQYPVIMADQPFVKVPQQFVSDYNNVREVRTGDIVITKVGTPCYAGIIDESLGYAALTRTVLAVTDVDQSLIDPYYLVVFLRSSFGFYQLMREREQQIQLQLTLDRVGDIDIYLPSQREQRTVAELFVKHHEKQQESQQLYQQAEEMLLTALSLDSLDLSPQLAYTGTFGEMNSADRFDAEYYQPKYYALHRRLHESDLPIQPLAALVEPIRNGFDYREYVDEGTPYIRVGDVRNGRIDLDGAAKVPIKARDVEKDISIRSGDILFTRKGTFGQAAVVRPEHTVGIISSEIMRLRLQRNAQILPDYLALFLNSKSGFEQVERRVHGVAYYSISQPDLATVEVAVPPMPIQQQIVDKILHSLAAQRDAKQLLETAKQRVEDMILGDTLGSTSEKSVD